jgi:hypothetical protein
VHAEVRQVEEKGPVAMPPDEVHRPVGQEIGEVLAFRVGRGGLGLEVEVPAIGDDGLVETAAARQVLSARSEVPLTEHRGRVTGRLKDLRQQDAVERQIGDVVHRAQRARGPVEAVGTAHRVDPGARRVLTSHQSGAGGCAILMVVVVHQPRALSGEAV